MMRVLFSSEALWAQRVEEQRGSLACRSLENTGSISGVS